MPENIDRASPVLPLLVRSVGWDVSNNMYTGSPGQHTSVSNCLDLRTGESIFFTRGCILEYYFSI